MLHTGNLTAPRHFVITVTEDISQCPKAKSWIHKLNTENEYFNIETREGQHMDPDLSVTYGDGLFEPILDLDRYLSLNPKDSRPPIMNG